MSENMMTKPAGKNDLASIINSDSMKAQWALVLPKHLTADRLARVALTQLRKTPKLAQCTPDSLLGALMTCSELGIEPNGRDAHLIPYGKECTLIVDFKGLVRMVRRDTDVKDVQVFTVREGDDFRWSPEGIEHTFSLTKDRGDVVGCYTKISWMNGTVSYGEPMTKQEAEAIKKGSRAGSSGPWVSHFNEMWKKSVIRRDSKMWPLSPETQDNLLHDNDVPVELAASGSSSGPVYDAPAIPDADESDDQKLTDPEDMDKSGCKAEMKSVHSDKPYFDDVLGMHMPPDDHSWDKCSVSMLRPILVDMRLAADKS